MKRLALLLFLGSAGAISLPQYLAPLSHNPNLLAAQEQVLAAEQELLALKSPIALQASGGGSLLNVAPPPASCSAPPPPGLPFNPNALNPACASLPTSGEQVNLSLTLTPIPLGVVGGRVAQAEVSLARAQLAYRQALTGLEVQALLANEQVRLAEQGLQVAQEGVQVAQEGLQATQIQLHRGGATPLQLAEAQESLAQAKANQAQAEESLSLAQSNLESLLGTAEAPALEVPLPAPGTPASVQEAQLAVEQAQQSLYQAEWSALPVLSASYTNNTSPTTSYSLSIQSETLQPQIGFTYQNPGTQEPQSRIQSEVQVGLSLTLSPGVFEGLRSAQAAL
jgi:outer membrane protein